MGGDEISAESAKTVDVTQREGVAAGLKQAAHASAVAWSNPDWVAKTVTGATSTFVHSVEVADQIRIQKSAIAAQDVAAGRAAPESFVEHVNKDLPPGKTIGDRRFNCANCSVATDATLDGNPASALPGCGHESKKFVESGDFLDSTVGTGPMVVLDSGRCHLTTTGAGDAQQILAECERDKGLA